MYTHRLRVPAYTPRKLQPAVRYNTQALYRSCDYAMRENSASSRRQTLPSPSLSLSDAYRIYSPEVTSSTVRRVDTDLISLPASRDRGGFKGNADASPRYGRIVPDEIESTLSPATGNIKDYLDRDARERYRVDLHF